MTQRQTIMKSDREERAASNEIRITITLIAVVIMFLVCQLPTAATLIYNIFHDPAPQSDQEAVLRALGNIFNCLVSVNAACNFVLYCALSDKYRRTFMRTFCRCVYRPASSFFTQVEDNGHHGNQHSRQPSVCANQRDRYASGRPGQIHRTLTAQNSVNGSYLVIPDGSLFFTSDVDIFILFLTLRGLFFEGNGSIACQTSPPSIARRQFGAQPGRNLRSTSLQSNNCGTHSQTNTMLTTNTLLLSKINASEPASGTGWSSRWWQSMATKRKIPSNSKPTNILIQITSDAAEETSHEPQPSEQCSLKQTSDDEVAFV